MQNESFLSYRYATSSAMAGLFCFGRGRYPPLRSENIEGQAISLPFFGGSELKKSIYIDYEV